MEEVTEQLNNDNTDDNIKYISGEFLLNILQTEYSYENERVRSLESRTGVFIAFLGALLVFLMDKLKLPSINVDNEYRLIEAFPRVLMILLTIFSLISIIIAIIYFVKVISIQTYKRLSFTGFNETNAKHKKEEVAVSIMIQYQDVITHNNDINNKKVKYYRTGIYYILAGLIFSVASFVISLFI